MGAPVGISPGPPPGQHPCRPRGACPRLLLAHSPLQPSRPRREGPGMIPEGGQTSVEAPESTRVSLSPAGAW